MAEFEKDGEGQSEALIQQYFPDVVLADLTMDEWETWLLKAQWLEKRYFQAIHKTIAEPICKTIVEVAKKLTRKK